MAKVKEYAYKEHTRTWYKLKEEDRVKSKFNGTELAELHLAMELLTNPQPKYVHEEMTRNLQERAWKLAKLVKQWGKTPAEAALVEWIANHKKMEKFFEAKPEAKSLLTGKTAPSGTGIGGFFKKIIGR